MDEFRLHVGRDSQLLETLRILEKSVPCLTFKVLKLLASPAAMKLLVEFRIHEKQTDRRTYNSPEDAGYHTDFGSTNVPLCIKFQSDLNDSVPGTPSDSEQSIPAPLPLQGFLWEQATSVHLPLAINFGDEIGLPIFGRPIGSVLDHHFWKVLLVNVVAKVIPDMIALFVGPSADRETWLFAYIFIGDFVLIATCLVSLLSMQKRVLRMLIVQTHPWYIMFVTLLGEIAYVQAAVASLSKAEIFLNFATSISSCLFVAVLAFADALLPRTRRRFLRFLTPFACLVVTGYAVSVRLPGQRIFEWFSAGGETVTNIDVAAKSSSVLLILLSRGIWSGWRHPDQLAYFRSATRVSEGNSNAIMIH